MSDHAEGGARRPVRKVAPSNGQAEMAVLGAVLLSPDRFHEVAGLVRTDDFLIPAHREIWDAFVHVEAEKKALDVVGIADALRDRQVTARLPEGEMYLLKLTGAVSTAENVMHYARIVRSKSELRQLIAVCTETASRAYAADDPEELAADCLAKLEKIGAYARVGGPSRIGAMVSGVLDDVENREKKQGSAYVRIGLTGYDAKYGGIPAGSLVIVAQRPGQGKTGFVVSTLIRMGINGTPTLMFSQEMKKSRIVERALSFTSRIEARKFRRGTIERGEWKDVHRGSKVLYDIPFDIDDRTDMTAELMRAEIRRWCYQVDREAAQQGKERPLKVVAVDSMSLTVPEKPGKNRMDDVTKMSREFKNLAQGMNVIIILIVHLSREIEKGKKPRKPKLSDLRECVTGDTLVSLTDGSRIPIRELTGKEPEVWSISKKGEVVPACSDKVWCVGKRDVIRVRLASGRSVSVTREHRLMGSGGWQGAGTLRIGDRLAIARKIPVPAQCDHWPDDRVALLGQLIGDGSYLVGSPLRYTTNSEENSSVVAEASTKEFGCVVKRYAGRRSWHQLLVSGNGNRWHPSGVNKWLRELGVFGQRSHEKRIPVAAFRLANAQVALLLRHLWATDGTIAFRKCSTGPVNVSYATNSRGLADDVAALLLRFGIVARVNVTKKGSYRDGYMVRVSGVEDQRVFLEQIGTFGPRVLPGKRLAEMLRGVRSNTNVDTLPVETFDRVRSSMSDAGITQRQMASLRGTSYGGAAHFKFAPSRAVVADYAEILGDAELANAAASSIFWDRVVGIDEVGNEEVFDLTVPGPASWLADAIVSHNSGALEQDADVVIFPWREPGARSASGGPVEALLLVPKARDDVEGGEIPVQWDGRFTAFYDAPEDPEV